MHDAHDARDRGASPRTSDMMELIKEFGLFLKYRKKYWLAPIIVVLLVVGLVIVVSTGALSPVLYALF